MATLPPDPYAPDPVVNPDGTKVPRHQPDVLSGPENSDPPKLDPNDIERLPVNQPPPAV